MVVGSGLIELFIPEVHSLKEKRSVLTKLIKRTQNEFNVSIAEVGEQDVWRRARIGISMVGNDRRVINAKMDHVLKFIEDLHIAEITGFKMELTSFSHQMGAASSYGDEKYGDI